MPDPSLAAPWRAGAGASSHREYPARASLLAFLAVSFSAPAFTGCGPGIDIVAVHREVCDGVDNDWNGVVDDLDTNSDGLCDCLRIGVFGYPGSRAMDQLQGLMHSRAVPTGILAGKVMTAELLSMFDIVLVQDVQDGQATGTVGTEGNGIGIGRVFSDAEIKALLAWVSAGGGLMSLSGYTANPAEVTNVNRLLSPFGMSYAPQIVLNAGGATASVPVTHWESTHPLARSVTRVGVATANPVSGGALVAWEPTPGSFDVGRAVEWGRGHVFVWADEWITYDSDWGTAEYQNKRLWLNSFKWLSVNGYCQVPVPAPVF